MVADLLCLVMQMKSNIKTLCVNGRKEKLSDPRSCEQNLK